MKFTSSITILLAACAANGFDFAFRSGKNIERRNVDLALNARVAPSSLSNNTEISKTLAVLSSTSRTADITTQLSASHTTITPATFSVASSIKGPETNVISPDSFTQTHPTTSILTTAAQTETTQFPPSASPTVLTRSSSTTSSAVFGKSNSFGDIVNGAPSTEDLSITLSVSTSSGQNIVVASIVALTTVQSVAVVTEISTADDLTTISSTAASSASLSVAESAQDASTTFGESTQQETASITTSAADSVVISTFVDTVLPPVTVVTVTSSATAIFSTSIPLTDSAKADSTTFAESTMSQDVASSDNASGSVMISTIVETATATDDIVTITSSAGAAPTSSVAPADSSIQAVSTTFADPTTSPETTSVIDSVVSTSVLVSTVIQTSFESGSDITITSSPQLSTVFVAESEIQGTSTSTEVDATFTMSVMQTMSVTETADTPAQITVSVTESGTVVALPTPSSSANSLPIIVQTSGVYTYLGCYTEGAGMRALQGEFFPDDSNTVERCTANCYPFQYAGLEYGRECWCGDTIEGGASSVQNLQCGMACAGNSGEICGDSNRLSIYQWNGNSTEGPAMSSGIVSSASLPAPSQLPSSTPDQSVTSLPSSGTTPSTTDVSPSQSPSSNIQSLPPSISLETTTVTGQSLTHSFTLPPITTTALSLATIYSDTGSSIACTIGAVCNCPAQVTVTVTQIQTVAHNTSKSGSTSWVQTTATILKGSSTKTSSSATTSPTQQTTSGASIVERSFSLFDLLGFAAMVILI